MDRFDSLQTFVAVVEAGSFSAAAVRLDRAKSAVSRQLAALEAHLGVQLLNRTTRRLSFTEAGREFHERAQRILADLEEAELSVAAEQTALRGRLRLAAPLSFGVQHLAPALAEFLAQHPELVLDLDLDDRRINLVEEGFDLALRIGELPDSSLVARPLAPIRMQLCASPDYLRRHGTPRRPEDLAFHAGLVYGNVPEAQQWRLLDAAGKVHSVKVPARLRANNGDVLIRAAVDGLGVVVSPTFIAHRALAAGELVPLLPEYQAAGTMAYAVYPSRRHLPQRVRVLIDFLAQRFGDTPYWDQT
ncbi:MAG: LysR family transcriptional regulator [Chiayiivirga sp.]|jgi:DNA-binding transcriptional LysR family regulator|nr:LysR family transcriptional regulator [Chiayiivirga sp.]